MKKINIRFVLSCLLAITFIPHHSIAQKLRTNGFANTEHDSIKSIDDKKVAVIQLYADATSKLVLGDTAQAIDLFHECLSKDPNQDAAWFQLANVAYCKNDYSTASTDIQKALAINGTNIWYNQLYAEVLGAQTKYKDAGNVYLKLMNQDPDNTDYWFALAYYAAKANDYQGAINYYNKIQQQSGINEDLVSAKEELWLKLNKPDSAVSEVKQLIQSDTTQPRYYAMLADLYKMTNNKGSLATTLQEMLKDDPQNPQALLSLADLYHLQNDDKRAFEYEQRAFESPAMDIDSKVQVLVGYISQLKDSTQRKEALSLAKITTQTDSGEAKAFAVYGDLLATIDSNKAAVAQYRKAVSLDQSRFAVWEQVLILYSQLNENDSLYNTAKKVAELFPDQALSFYYYGNACLTEKKYDEAAAQFTKAVQMGSDNKDLMAQLYANLGDVYYYEKDFKKSDSSYDQALVVDPKNAYALNNYSYFLSVRGNNLDKAEEMASKLVKEIAPNNSSYEDTYGWVLFKLKRYDDAQTWTAKAMKDGGDNNGTILEHYGDILFRLGKTDDALTYWKKAKTLSPDSTSLDKKIQEQKLDDEDN
jgi:tetratricopeptide (TPR) repeat protein